MVLFLGMADSCVLHRGGAIVNRELGHPWHVYCAGTQAGATEYAMPCALTETSIIMHERRSKNNNKFRREVFDLVVTL